MDERESRVLLARIIVAAVLLVAAVALTRLVALPLWGSLLLFAIPYLVVGYDVLQEAWEGICEGDPFDEDLLMSLATLGALCIGFFPGSEPEFAEAVFVMLFFQVGELIEELAEGTSTRSIAHLMEIRPDSANLERDGSVVVVRPEEVRVGDVVVVRPGERVPLDGQVVEGTSSLNTVALTGESVPRDVTVGEGVASGCVNVSGVLRVRVEKPFGDSTANRILDLVRSASEHKSTSEGFITRFAHVYTPVVVLLALVAAFVPPIFAGDYLASFPTWLNRALTFLVVSCPCALVISVPLTFFGGIGGASRHGILIKGSNYLEALARTDTVVFDKTGTLTRGVFDVRAVHPTCMAGLETGGSEAERLHLLHLAAHVEHFSTHPIADALRAAYPDVDDDCTVSDVQESAGRGIVATVNGRRVAVGTGALMEAEGARWHQCERVGTVIHVSIDGAYAGHILIADEVKDDAASAIRDLSAAGVRRTVMLTGDRHEVADDVARRLGIATCLSELLPEGKVAAVERLLKEEDARHTLAFVGDGINDAPVLARSDVGIAMGAMGSDAAIDAADVVLMDDRPSKIATAIRRAHRTLRIARENTWFAIGVKIVVLALATFGLAPMWLAVFADVGVMVLAVLNATRALR